MNIAIIPARGGSRRIHAKNIRVFHGKPIIAYSIECAKASGLFSKIVVSTDSDLIGAIAMDYGASYLRRRASLAADDVGTQEVVRDVLEGLAEFTHACCIYATAPMLSPEDLRAAYARLETAYSAWFFVPGWYYWGRVTDFEARTPLRCAPADEMPRPAGRYIDINTEEDWIRAELMYTALKGRP